MRITTHTAPNDGTLIPTTDEKAALAGTSGTPSGSNKYVTNADWRLDLQSAATTLNTTVNIASTSNVDLVSQTVTIAATDIWEMELWGTFLNNSTATRVYTLTWSCGALSAAGSMATIANHATNRVSARVGLKLCVQSATSANIYGWSNVGEPAALGASQRLVAANSVHSANESSSDFTGSQTIKIQMRSASATATQTFYLNGWTLRKINA